MNQQPEVLHERLDSLMGPKLVAFLDRIKAAYASGDYKQVFAAAAALAKAEGPHTAHPTVEQQVEQQLQKAESSTVDKAPTTESLPVAATATQPAETVVVSERATKKNKNIPDFLAALRQRVKTGMSVLQVSPLPAAA